MFSGFFRLKNGLRIVLTLISLLWSGAINLRASDRYVATNGTDTGDFLTWATASSNIQWAVNKALSANDTVWVSNGTFVLTNQIVVTNNIVLRSANGPNGTIVNGGFVEGAAVPTNNRCLFLSNISAFVSGFTFSNGACDTNGGGGVWIGAGTLSNCTVCNNKAFVPTNFVSVGGGGILLKPSGTVAVCRLTGNNVSNTAVNSSYGGGGGIYAYNAGCAIYDCLVSNNSIKGITASRSGGGIYAYYTRVRSCMICNNDNSTNIPGETSGGIGGGINMAWYSTMESSTVTVNRSAGGSGAGCYLTGGTISNCIISYNYISDNDAGSGLTMYPQLDYTACSVFNTTFTGNTNTAVRMYNASGGTNQLINCIMEDSKLWGLVIRSGRTNTLNIVSNCVVRRNGVGVRCYATWETQIRNCLIANNSNYVNYGGLYLGANCNTVLVSGCTVVSNYGTNYGAGLRFEGAVTALLSSCIIYSNGVGGTNDLYDDSAPANYGRLQYSCVGTNPGFTGAGIIVTNPQFANFSGGNFRLSGSSPCINAGSNEPWMTNAVDLDGRTRLRYGRVDMGAYEAIRDATVYRFR